MSINIDKDAIQLRVFFTPCPVFYIDRDVNSAQNNGLHALADGGFGRPPEY
ncbi:hypothetical protein BE221DRAFT_80311 [Ostreococcus tauri]|uniref:Uncharacterized protein n=1 Tax=Ostreococcus tauri TaxID=70448 RepID=A0A1Y5I8M9_OSTTA|nr:hypothetical protein BE221DRAFT_80311 [Ostreococcus tauri]